MYKFDFRKNEQGRSMVEMLGVLAIIGILSVTAFYGYTMAIRRYRANEIVQTATMLSIIEKSANAGEGGCLLLSSTNLEKKPGGIQVEMKSETLGGDNGEESFVYIKIIDDISEKEELCSAIESMAPSVNCEDGDIDCE